MPGRDGTGPYGAGLSAFSYTYPGPGFAMWVNKGRWIGQVPWIEQLWDGQTLASDSYADIFKQKTDEKEYLTKVAGILKMRLQEVNNRIKEIDESIGK